VTAWLILFAAGLLEIVWALSLKASDGFSRLWPSVLTVVAAGASFLLLAQAMRVIPVGTAYAVWTGIGAVGVAAFALAFQGEPASAARLAGIALIVAGIATLKLA
jgi:quaternary ammonium compound-resistance protein SugE